MDSISINSRVNWKMSIRLRSRFEGARVSNMGLRKMKRDYSQTIIKEQIARSLNENRALTSLFFEVWRFFLMPSVDTWLNHPDNPRIRQDNQSIRGFPLLTSRFDLKLLGLRMVGFITTLEALQHVFD